LTTPVEVELLPASAADDVELVARVSDLVNRASRTAEQGMWLDGILRTTPADAVRRGELAVARDDGRLAGSVRTRLLDGETAWFGALAVDHERAGRGVGGALVRFAEDRARAEGARAMQIELVVPADGHPHTDLLAGWYGRLGYREVERRDPADVDPVAAPFLAVEAAVAVMRKRLRPPASRT
jgi:ribosomal protein S18 acetylase RimI-like enzyme